jgi:hypothetical protein
MNLQTLRKFWWVPLLTVVAGLFLLPSNKSVEENSYSVFARFRTRPAYAPVLLNSAKNFCDSSTCFLDKTKFKFHIISTRENEFIFIDIFMSAKDSGLLVDKIPLLDECLKKDQILKSLVFMRNLEVGSLIYTAKNLLTQVSRVDSINRFRIQKDLFDLTEKELEMQDQYGYSKALPQDIRKQAHTGQFGLVKRTVILTVVGLFLMVLLAELVRKRKNVNV